MGKRVGKFRDRAAEAAFFEAYREALTPPEEVHDVPTSFGTTRVYRYGPSEGAPIVLLHGLNSTSAPWKPFLGAFTGAGPVYAVDSLGEAGGSVQTVPFRSAADRARALDEVLAGLGLSGVHVVGASEGGWLGTRLVVHAPDRVATLSLLEPTTVTSRYSPGVMWRGLLAGVTRSERLVRRMLVFTMGRDLLDRPDVRVVLLGVKAYRSRLPLLVPLPSEELRAVRVPVLAVFGARNVVHDAVSAATRLGELVPHAVVEVWPDVGHDLGQFDDTRPITDRVLGFVREHDS
ncbi:alpha/beta hydrolase [Umezawaea sp.]|uniref:alpha/beta fold hydrolase n=1 Tax=Umezawaea sp. TaxID=1955258 RepID=UPI002ED3D0AC